MILSLQIRFGGDMCSPEATNGVITCDISPPRRNSVRIASAATSFSRTPGATAAMAVSVTASAMRGGLLHHRDLLGAS